MENGDEYTPTVIKNSFPCIVSDERGNEYTVVDLLCIKFLSMHLHINGEKPDIKDVTVPEDNLLVNCRIKILLTDKGTHLVSLEDEIYDRYPVIYPIANINYTYNVFADAVSYYKNLGYHETFDRTRFTDREISHKRIKNTIFEKWWVRRKAKL